MKVKIELEITNCRECPYFMDHEDKEYRIVHHYCKLIYNKSVFLFEANIDEDTIIRDDCPFRK